MKLSVRSIVLCAAIMITISIVAGCQRQPRKFDYPKPYYTLIPETTPVSEAVKIELDSNVRLLAVKVDGERGGVPQGKVYPGIFTRPGVLSIEVLYKNMDARSGYANSWTSPVWVEVGARNAGERVYVCPKATSAGLGRFMVRFEIVKGPEDCRRALRL
ncbi:MAG: hypothetical protein RIF32_04430 [Leptospirales bacterium]|jgi:hypothetical protein